MTDTLLLPDAFPLAPPAGAPALAPARPDAYRLGYFFFLLVNATLFIRPGEIFPDTAGWPIYNVLILCGLFFSLPAVFRQLHWYTLRQNPAALCVLALLPAIALSHLTHGRTWEAREGATEFSKCVVYFLLLVALVDSPARLRHFLGVTSLLILAIAVISLLKYHGVISMDAISVLDRSDAVDPETGELLVLQQLQASGIFSDPNDFSLILAVAVLAVTHFAIEARNALVRLAWCAPLPVLVYAFALTRSRGGFLALLAGFCAFTLARWGRRRGMVIGLAMLPVFLVVFAGRQTNIDFTNKADTAQGRIQLWRDGMVLFKMDPAFGVGFDKYAEEVGQVAHNSYVHAFAELGFFGGTLFLAAVALPIAAGRKFARLHFQHQTAESRLNACVLAVIVAYAVGIFSLSRISSAATYLAIGVACASATILSRTAGEPLLPPLSFKLLRQLAAGGVVMLVVLYCFTRFLVF
jgi:O-antigen ligase